MKLASSRTTSRRPFNIIYSTSSELSSTDNLIVDQVTPGVVGNATTDAYFGATVAP